MRAINKLTVKGIAAAPPGKHGDGGGLWLIKRPDGGAQWMLRVTVHGKRREMGLGAYPSVGLAEARKRAEEARAKARDNVDPIRERQRLRREAAQNLHLFKDIAKDAFESRKAELKEDGKAGRWFSPLELHVLPKIGNIPVSEINQIDIRDALSPIWHTKADTARKAIARVGICLRHAAALGLEVDLSATAKANALLGKRRHIERHIPALHWRDVPGFYASLNDGSKTHLALRLVILTGLRSGPVRFARLDQIEGDVWTIPGGGMKGRLGKSDDFRVPLSPEALSVIEQASRFSRDGFLFPGLKKGVISDQTMSGLMKKRGLEACPHGFRSSLRDWLSDVAGASYEISERMLAHSVGSKTSKAYFRTDQLEQRRVLLNRWADYVTGGSGKLLKLRETA